jgi:hypothetical protein
MAVTASWSEWNSTDSNISTPTVANISNSNWGSTDAANLTPTTYPISAGSASFNKQQAIKFAATGGETVSAPKLFATAGLSGDGQVSGNSDQLIYKDVGAISFSTPSSTLLTGTSGMPNGEPGTANLTMDSGGTYTNLFLTQLSVASGTTSGSSITLSFKYSVTA